jgi:hypothetical protein
LAGRTWWLEARENRETRVENEDFYIVMMKRREGGLGLAWSKQMKNQIRQLTKVEEDKTKGAACATL